MPQVLAYVTAFIVSSLSAAGLATVTPGLITFVSTVVSIAAAVAGYEVSTLLTPKPKLDSQTAQQPIRQATAPRRRDYGLVKASGIYSFIRAKDNWLYSVLMIASQEIDSIVEHWLNDQRVDAYMDVNGDITSGPLALDGSIAIVKIRHRLGLDTETPYSELTTIFATEYTPDHRLDGIFSVLIIEGALARNFNVYYPSGPYAYRAVFRAAKVWDPREPYQDANDPSTWEWSDNLALCVLDYLRHPDGMRLPYSLFANVIDDWSQQADICDEIIPLSASNIGPTESEIIAEILTGLTAWSLAIPGNAEGIMAMIAGGASLAQIRLALDKLRLTTTNPLNDFYLDPIIVTAHSQVYPAAAISERRYRLSGGYEFSTDPKDVLAAMLAPADGIITRLGDGSVVLRVARCAVEEPDVVIHDEHILTYRMRRSVEKADLRNEIRATYTDPNNDFQEQESQPWVNQDSVDINGLLSVTLDLHFCPSPSQARRIQKIHAYKLDPRWSGEITTNAYGLDSLSSQFIRVQISDLGIDEIFEKLTFETDPVSGVCKISIRSFPPEALEWNPTEEEGEPSAISGLGSNVNRPDPPQNFNADWDTTLGVIRLTGSADPTPDRNDLNFEVEWSLSSSPDVWTPFISADPGGGYFATYQPAYAGTTYDVRARFVSTGGLASSYVTDTVTPTSDVLDAPTGTLEEVDV